MRSARGSPRADHPGNEQARVQFHEAGNGGCMEPVNHVRGWLACLRDFSPFAFGDATLEQQYQVYLSAHMGSHVGAMCWVLAAMSINVCILAWQQSDTYPHFWFFCLPLAVSLGVGFFKLFSPAAFRKHWHVCSLAITAVYVLVGSEVMGLSLVHHAARERLHARTLWELETYRLLMWMLLAAGLPLSLPAWGLAQIPFVLKPAFGLANHYERALLSDTPGSAFADTNDGVHGFECLPAPWPVLTAMQCIITAYLGPGALVSDSARCKSGVVFWETQIGMIGAVIGVVRDVVWRRSFLRGHPHLRGHDGVAHAAAGPFGSQDIMWTCFSLMLWLVSTDVVVVYSWVTVIAEYN